MKKPRSISLGSLLTALADNATHRFLSGAPIADPGGVGATVRFPPELRSWLDEQARTLGVPLSAVVVMGMSGLMEASKIEARGVSDGGGLAAQVELIAARFQQLLIIHGINVPMALELFAEDGITAAILANSHDLADRLGQGTLNRIAQEFAASARWLSAESDQPGIVTGRWYKELSTLFRHVDQLARSGQEPEIILACAQSADLDGSRGNEDTRTWTKMTVLVRRRVFTDSKYRQVVTVEQWATEPWSYRPVRDHLKAIVAWGKEIGRPHSIRVSGYQLRDDIYIALQEFRLFPIEALRSALLQPWYPEDYIDGTKQPEELDSMRSILQRAWPNLRAGRGLIV